MGSVDIGMCVPYWDSLGIVPEAEGVSSGYVPSSEMCPEQEGVPCSVEGSVDSCGLH